MGSASSGRPKRPAPREGINPWPGPREAVVADPDVEHVRLIVVALDEVIGTRSNRSVAAQVGMTHQALADLRAGRTWPEVATVARIERGLGVRLWPVVGEGS